MSRQPNMVALQESSNRDGDHFLFLNYSPYSFVTLICLVTAIEIHSVAAAVDHPSLSPSLSSLGTVYSLELPTRVSFPHWISLRSLFLLSPVTTFSHVYSRHFRFYRCLTLDLDGVTDRRFRAAVYDENIVFVRAHYKHGRTHKDKTYNRPFGIQAPKLETRIQLEFPIPDRVLMWSGRHYWGDVAVKESDYQSSWAERAEI